MKTALPASHNLSDRLLNNTLLMPMKDGNVSITDAQFDALEAGLGRGQSLLICAPTSTGKTLIGWWAAASAFERGKRVVYLVSHRALASQKFEEIQNLFLDDWLNGDATSLVCATGDGVYDATRRANSAPLAASILVATYEKYLALMSAGGPPQDLEDVVFICDEVQLIGDGSRGKHVELLLSVLKRTGWHQFIGLSAVMDGDGAAQFADWLNLALVHHNNPIGYRKGLCLIARKEDEVAAVIVPSLAKAGRSWGILSGLPRPGASSVSTVTSPLRVAKVTPTTSSANAPLSMAALARRSDSIE